MTALSGLQAQYGQQCGQPHSWLAGDAAPSFLILGGTTYIVSWSQQVGLQPPSTCQECNLPQAEVTGITRDCWASPAATWKLCTAGAACTFQRSTTKSSSQAGMDGVISQARYVARRLSKSVGKAAWLASTTLIVLLLPLVIEMDREQQLLEMEKDQMTVLTSPKSS